MRPTAQAMPQLHCRAGVPSSTQVLLMACSILLWPAQVVRESDGYQGHLVSPEMGLRRMVDETLGLVLDPVSTAVRRVHQVLVDAAR